MPNTKLPLAVLLLTGLIYVEQMEKNQPSTLASFRRAPIFVTCYLFFTATVVCTVLAMLGVNWAK